MKNRRACFGWIVLLVGTLLLAACSSTTLRSSWYAEPRAETPLGKIAVFVLSDNAGRAQIAETVIANQLGSAAVPSHRILQPGEAGNKDKVEARLRALGYDGAISVRLLSVENKERYVPPVIIRPQPGITMPGYWPNTGFYDYYHVFYSPTHVLPGYTQKYKEVVVESIAYSLRSNEAVWVGITETQDPQSVGAAAEEIGREIRDALRKAGLLK